MNDYSKMTDKELVLHHRQMERIANILHQGIKIGAAKRFWKELHETTLQNMFAIEEEYYHRHPKAEQNAILDLLKFADMLIDQNNRELFGDKSKAEQHILVEYHKPEKNKKTVTIGFRNEPGGPAEHIKTEMEMTGDLDFLKAALEKALDDIAETLPDPPEAENNNAKNQEG